MSCRIDPASRNRLSRDEQRSRHFERTLALLERTPDELCKQPTLSLGSDPLRIDFWDDSARSNRCIPVHDARSRRQHLVQRRRAVRPEPVLAQLRTERVEDLRSVDDPVRREARTERKLQQRRAEREPTNARPLW